MSRARRRSLLHLRPHRHIHRAGLTWLVFPVTLLLTVGVTVPLMIFAQTHAGPVAAVAHVGLTVAGLGVFSGGLLLEEMAASLDPGRARA